MRKPCSCPTKYFTSSTASATSRSGDWPLAARISHFIYRHNIALRATCSFSITERSHRNTGSSIPMLHSSRHGNQKTRGSCTSNRSVFVHIRLPATNLIQTASRSPWLGPAHLRSLLKCAFSHQTLGVCWFIVS